MGEGYIYDRGDVQSPWGMERTPPNVVGAQVAPGPRNFVRYGTPFIGREGDARELAQMLCAHEPAAAPLVTIFGPGGCGKTRLAQEVAFETASCFPDGAYLVRLEELRSSELVAEAISEAISVKEAPGEEALDACIRFLHQKHTLLILDNCEHLIPGVRKTTAAIHQRCQNVRILATSVSRLLVDWEQAIPIQGLEALDARNLFLLRARMADPSYSPDEPSLNEVDRLCELVSGNALAICLVAARIDVLTPSQLAEHFLAIATPADASRHQSLRATVAWSCGLLTAEARVLYEDIGCFAAGVPESAIRSIAAGSGRAPAVMALALTALVDASLLLRRAGSDGTVTYGLLEYLRLYAREQLALAHRAEELARIHAAYVLSITAPCEAPLSGREQRITVDSLSPKQATASLNLIAAEIRQALAWSLSEDHSTYSRLCADLWAYWSERGALGEGRQNLETALDLWQKDDAIRARLLNGLGELTRYQGDLVRAEWAHRECATLQARVGSEIDVSDSFNNLGDIFLEKRALDQAQREYMRALRIRRKAGYPRAIGYTLTNLGLVAHGRGRHDRALRLHRLAEPLLESGTHLAARAYVLCNQAFAQLELGNLDASARCLRESLQLQKEVGDQWAIARALEAWISLAVLEGNAALAARIRLATDRMYDAIGMTDLSVPSWSKHIAQRRDAALLAAGHDDSADTWQDLVGALVDGTSVGEE